MPEQFYTTFHWLPVITPELYTHFESKIGPIRSDIVLWTLCSGSSRLSATMAQLPFLQAVLFPVDLRYGWDLRDSYHQQLLQRANDKYKPFLTTIEPRNQHWCKHNRDDHTEELIQRQRDSDTPVLKFLMTHSIHLTREHQNVQFECAKISAIWTNSPLQCLKHHRHV